MSPGSAPGISSADKSRRVRREIVILAPVLRPKEEKNEEPTESTSAVAGFRAAYVFDITQTDGKELPAIGTVQGDPKDCTVRLQAFAKAQGISLEYRPGSGRAGVGLSRHRRRHERERSGPRTPAAENAAAPPRSASARRKRKPPPLWSRARLASTGSASSDYIHIWNGESSSPRVFPPSDKPLRSSSRRSPTSERLCGRYKSRPFVRGITTQM